MERNEGIGLYLIASFVLAFIAAWLSWGTDFVILDAVNLWIFGLIADIIFVIGIYFIVMKRPGTGSVFLAIGIVWIWWVLQIASSEFFDAVFLYIALGLIAWGFLQPSILKQ